MFKNGMAWSHRVKCIKKSCVWRVRLFIYYHFKSEIHSPFSKRSENIASM